MKSVRRGYCPARTGDDGLQSGNPTLSHEVGGTGCFGFLLRCIRLKKNGAASAMPPVFTAAPREVHGIAFLTATCRSASIAPSREELGALPAPPRQCCPHRRGVSPEADRIYGQAGDAPTLVVHSVPESLPECPAKNLSHNKKDDALTM